MPLYALGDHEPSIHPEAFVHPDAVVIGQVSIGRDSSVWPGAVLRGDNSLIVVGERTSVQDGSVIHSTEELQTVIGDGVVIGHMVHLEGCTIESNTLIGVGAAVLHRAIVRNGAMVAAGAVVLNDTVVPSGALAMGVPAKIREGAANPTMAAEGSQSYVERARLFRAQMRRIDR